MAWIILVHSWTFIAYVYYFVCIKPLGIKGHGGAWMMGMGIARGLHICIVDWLACRICTQRQHGTTHKGNT